MALNGISDHLPPFEWCVGSQDGEDKSRVWFNQWFLSLGHFEAPGCIWHRDGRKITKTMTRDGTNYKAGWQRIWMLTDQKKARGWLDETGELQMDLECTLGVWPD